MLCYNGLGDDAQAEAHKIRYLRYKADESAQAITDLIDRIIRKTTTNANRSRARFRRADARRARLLQRTPGAVQSIVLSAALPAGTD